MTRMFTTPLGPALMELLAANVKLSTPENTEGGWYAKSCPTLKM